ncbi:Gfo/Idh/MocA family oxidoreductase [Vallitalea okinawensis]|uniref:Gfo/Idh/MocA family oxidoreductase n=1 Tax=Vallitalea okinawensis TaxID=2078660 RepID=UPI000CFD07BF|nr:Gfo/Idh/MocA family oxidoreductase [Vallitalea okinawensis]
MKKLKVGIIGFGNGRIFHAPFIDAIEELELYKIYTRNEESKRIANELYPQTQVVSETRDIFEDDDVELVVISVPNTYHYSLAKEGLESGKHVVVEKPFTITTEEADELIALATDKNLFITTYHNRRFDSDYKTINKVLESKELGRLVEFESHYDRFRNFQRENAWREEKQPGSGILYDLGAHLIDQALALFGMPEQIYADVRIQRDGSQIDDNFEIILYYDSDLKVTLKSGMLVKAKLPKYILLGHEGSYVKYGLDPQEAALKEGRLPRNCDNWGVEDKTIWGERITEKDGSQLIKSEVGDYREFYQNIYDVIVNKVDPIVKPEEGRDVIYIIEAALKSNLAGKRINIK